MPLFSDPGPAGGHASSHCGRARNGATLTRSINEGFGPGFAVKRPLGCTAPAGFPALSEATIQPPRGLPTGWWVRPRVPLSLVPAESPVVRRFSAKFGGKMRRNPVSWPKFGRPDSPAIWSVLGRPTGRAVLGDQSCRLDQNKTNMKPTDIR
jgi:hypothetical protein